MANENKNRLNCRCKYRMRWFYSKGSLLVLVWCFLLSVTCNSVARTHFELSFPYWTGAVPLSVGIPALIIAGYLADRKFGVYKVARFGLIVLFIGTVSVSVYTCLDLQSQNQYVLATVYTCIALTLISVGLACVSVTILQLGIDQMPDASSTNICSFIAWFVLSIFAGKWISDILFYINWNCINYSFSKANIIQIWNLHTVICTSLILVLDFLLARKFLIIQPRSPQSLRTIYQVLKFAAKHSAPLNRSALTYWEEDAHVPSRIDLGKSRYGGPFTTEQVEDVKTSFRLLVIYLPIVAVCVSSTLNSSIHITSLAEFNASFIFTTCQWTLLTEFSIDDSWCVIIGTVVYEFVIYPFFGNKFPSILKRIGIYSLLIVLVNLVLLTLHLINHFCGEQEVPRWITNVIYSVSSGLFLQLFVCSLLELVHAQAPYNMRGLFSSYFAILVVISAGLGKNVYFYQCESSGGNCESTKFLIVLCSKLALSLFGFILYCILAHWYKRRVRDEEYETHRVVEEVYNRYLTAEIQHRQPVKCNNRVA